MRHNATSLAPDIGGETSALVQRQPRQADRVAPRPPPNATRLRYRASDIVLSAAQLARCAALRVRIRRVRSSSATRRVHTSATSASTACDGAFPGNSVARREFSPDARSFSARPRHGGGGGGTAAPR